MSSNRTSSIVVVNYNGGPLLRDCIESVRLHTRDYEIVLIDNASTDASLRLVKAGPDIRILRLARNFGFARANNIGIGASSSPYVVLLNSDTIVTSSWLESLLKMSEQSADIGLVTPKLLRANNHARIDSTGHIFQYETGKAVDRGYDELDKGQYEKPTDLHSCCFACVLVKRSVFDRIGVLDQKMFFYYEDVDFCIRARTAGWRVVYCPNSVVYHFRGGSTPPTNRKNLASFGRVYPTRVILKNYETKNMILYGGRSIIMDAMRILAGIGNFDVQYSRAYAKAIFWNLVHLPIAERLAVSRLRKVSDERLFKETRETNAPTVR